MKATVIALSITAAMCLGGITQAQEILDSPVMLSDVEMDQVVAGETQPPGWSQDGFPGATNGNTPYGADNPPEWAPVGYPGALNK